MDLTGLDLGAWLTESGAVVLVYEYDEVTQVFLGFVVHPMREVRYGKDGRLVSCCFLPGESQTVEHEQKLHKQLDLDRKLGDNEAVISVNHVEWMERSGEAALAPHRQYNFETQEWEPVVETKPVHPHEDWVEITDPNHVLRAGIDHIYSYVQGGYVPVDGSAGRIVGALVEKGHTIRCLRKHHPDFAPARRQDSAGAGIYDEQPPLVNTYADRTLNASRLLQDAVEEAKSAFDDPAASIEVVPSPLREWRVLTPGGCWETVKGTELVYLGGGVVEVFQPNAPSALFVNPQAVVPNYGVDEKPVILKVTHDMLHPLGDTLDHLYRLLVVCDGGSQPTKDAVKACVERFNNLVESIK